MNQAAWNGYEDLESGNYRANVGGGSNGGRGERLSLGAFETSLPIRVDYEVMMAYLIAPPAGGLFLLMFERKSDYVRYASLHGFACIILSKRASMLISMYGCLQISCLAVKLAVLGIMGELALVFMHRYLYDDLLLTFHRWFIF